MFSSIGKMLKEVMSVETGGNRIFTIKDAHIFG
jgi:hypothetical protein